MHVCVTIAFIVACLVSFRALFSQNERPKSNRPSARPAVPRKQPEGAGGSKPSAGYQSGGSTIVGQNSSNASRGTLNNMFQKSRFKVFQDSILDTCRTLEGLDDDDAMIEMDPLAMVDHERADVAYELGHIGGFQNMGQGTAQTIPIRSSHDSLENLNHEAAAECDSQGVSALDEEEQEFNAKNDVPRRRDTVLSHASQLSLDSLYMSRGDHSQRPSVDTHRGR